MTQLERQHPLLEIQEFLRMLTQTLKIVVSGNSMGRLLTSNYWSVILSFQEKSLTHFFGSLFLKSRERMSIFERKH